MTNISVACPTCKKTIVYDSTSPFRPFCSEQCKLIDLGEWASEGHVIEGGNDPFNDVMSDDIKG